MERRGPYHLDDVSPHMEEIGRNDARVDAHAGAPDRYTSFVGFLSDGHLSAPDWQVYRAAYEAERSRLLS